MKKCACGTLFAHPIADDCSLCGGRACAHCGRAKSTTLPTCGRTMCKRAATRAANVEKPAAATTTTAASRRAVLTYKAATKGNAK